MVLGATELAGSLLAGESGVEMFDLRPFRVALLKI